MADASVSCRVLIPCFKTKTATWPTALANFGVEAPGKLRIFGQPVGRYTAEDECCIGIVAPDAYQHDPPLEYHTQGFVIRFVAVTIDGAESDPLAFATLYASPHSPGAPFRLAW